MWVDFGTWLQVMSHRLRAGDVAPLVEGLPCTLEVLGSIPSRAVHACNCRAQDEDEGAGGSEGQDRLQLAMQVDTESEKKREREKKGKRDS